MAFYRQQYFNPYEMAVTPGEYCRIVGVPECAFWGVNTADYPNLSCPELWTVAMRYNLMNALMTAQAMIEPIIEYPLSPRWITGLLQDQLTEYDDNAFRWVDSQPFLGKQRAKQSRIIEVGARDLCIQGAQVTVDYSTEPAVVAISGLQFINEFDIRVTFPDSFIFIETTGVWGDTSYLEIMIPKCRLVKPEVDSEQDNGVDPSDISNFTETVDIYLDQADPSVNGKIISNHTCSPSCSDNACLEYTTNACLTIQDQRLGLLIARPAEYTDGVWQTSSAGVSRKSQIRLYYRAGLVKVPDNIKMAIVRLAHSLMPAPPCGCQSVSLLWEQDNAIPPFITPDRDNSPFGLSDGSWWAYKQTQTNRSFRLSVA